MASSLPCVAAPLSSSCFSSLPRELRGSSLSSSSVRTWTSQNLRDSCGSEELRARRSTILCGARGEHDHLAILFLGSHWSHLLCLLSILRNHDRRPTPSHRDPRRHMLLGDIPGGERRVPCPLALGLGLVF